MTTVAVAGLTVAADTRYTIGDGLYQANKLERVGDWIASTAGYAFEGDDFLDWLRQGQLRKRKRVSKSFEALLVRRDGAIYYVLGNDRLRRIRQHYYAIGSGAYYALGAMATLEKYGFPIDPEIAVSIASEWDVGTGGAVDVLTWRE
jgi:hypothetical protein